jgi:hypothetical protein
VQNCLLRENLCRLISRIESQNEIEKARIESQNETAGANIGQRIASDLLKAKQLEDKDAREDYKKGVDIGIDIAKDSNKND